MTTRRKPRRGRPTNANHRTVIVPVRFTGAELKVLEAAAKMSRQTRSQFVRDKVLAGWNGA